MIMVLNFKNYIKENVALSKAILNKQGITTESPEYSDYLKIRDICGGNHGYVGILTKIRFQDGISDMDEIQSIFDILKNSKIDVGKLNKLSYDDILDMFYDEFNKSDKNEDYELIFKDSEYTYYRVHTYKGIMKTGSPAWCLKTKSNWDKYQSVYPMQFVIVNNEYKNKLMTPDDDLLNNYSSKKGYVRYGISIQENGSSVKWVANDDNNRTCRFDPEDWTFFGVMCTILNIIGGVKKSYWDNFRGCEKVEGTKTWHKVVDREKAYDWLKIPKDYFDNNDELYVTLSETYSSYPVMIVLDDTYPHGFYPTNNQREIKYATLSGVGSKKIFEDYARRSDSELYLGVKLKLGLTTLDQIKERKKFITTIDKWMVFDRNENYYLVVNSNPDEYSVPTLTFVQSQEDIDEDPVFFYLNKSTLEPHSRQAKSIPIRDYHKLVIDELKGGSKQEDPKSVKSFWDFLKRK
jgi:hypothetical protein